MYLIRRDSAFGDVMMAGLAVATLNDHGVLAALNTNDVLAHSLLYIPRFKQAQQPNWEEHWFEYESFRHDTSTSYIQNWLNKFSKICGVDFKVQRQNVPVFFSDIPSTKTYDIAIGSQTGNWTPYRIWPHFAKLKKMLDKEGLTWIDLDENRIYSNECLNIIRRARLYLGLDTGRSHYVASEANGKALILQSGNNNKIQWSNYNYEFIEKKVDCSPCYLQSGCQHNHKCMNDIRPEFVLERIIDKLSRSDASQPSPVVPKKLLDLPVV